MSDEQKVQEELAPGQEIAPESAELDGQPEAAPEEAAVEAELAAARAEVANLQDQLVRSQAEIQNIRRRAEADVEKAHKFGVEKFASEMLAVVDNLERAIAACVAEDDATQAIREGVELTLTGLLNTLTKFNVAVVNPENEPFNPELHQAMSMVDVAEVAPNTVLTVMQKGYTLNERLLRPAMVVVSKGSPQIDAKA